MGCRQEVHNDSFLSGKVAGQWAYQKTGKKSGVVHGELIARNKDFNEIPCPDLCFDQIQVTGFPQESFFYSRLFAELSRLLQPQGKLCFILTPQAQDACNSKDAHWASIACQRAEETIIYYGMKNGFTFTKKEVPSGKRRKITEKPCYSLHLTLTNPATPSIPKPVSATAEKSGQTMLWFVKAPNHPTPEADPIPEG